MARTLSDRSTGHRADDDDHHHHGTSFGTALALTLGFALVEALGGWRVGSLALVSDAGHMFSDAAALGLAAFAGWISRRPAGERHSYGFVRAEVLAALLNGLAMLVVIVLIVVEAIERLLEPVSVAGAGVMAIAFIGLIINGLVAVALSRGEHTLNTRAALVHVVGDLLGSVAALIAGAVVYFTGWLPIDPILSMAIAGLILFSTISLLREAMHVLMEGVPRHVELAAVGRELAAIAGVTGVHDLHVWNISSGQVALSAHLDLEDMSRWAQILERSRNMLRERFGIHHLTLQPEVPGWLKQPYTVRVEIFPKG